MQVSLGQFCHLSQHQQRKEAHFGGQGDRPSTAAALALGPLLSGPTQALLADARHTGRALSKCPGDKVGHSSRFCAPTSCVQTGGSSPRAPQIPGCREKLSPRQAPAAASLWDTQIYHHAAPSALSDLYSLNPYLHFNFVAAHTQTQITVLSQELLANKAPCVFSPGI